MLNEFFYPYKCAIILSFDDCYQMTLDSILPLLEEHNLKATFNLVTGFLGKELGGLRIANLESLQTAVKLGHEIASHSVTHNRLDNSIWRAFMSFANSFLYAQKKFLFLRRSMRRSMRYFRIGYSPDKHGHMIEIIKELQDSRKEIEHRLSTNCLTFIYPGGKYNNLIKSLCNSSGYESARSSDIGFNDPNNLDFFSLKTQVWDLWTTAEKANIWVDKAIREGYCLIECFHLVGDRNVGNYHYYSSVNEVAKHLAYISSKKTKILVETQANVMRLIRTKRCLPEANI